MTLRLTPTADTPYLRRLLADIPKNLQYLTATVDLILPLDFEGAEFTLEVSDPGVPVEITIDRSNDDGLYRLDPPTILRIIPREEVTQVRLPLTSGINRIKVVSDLEGLEFRVGMATWATWVSVFGKQVNDNILVRLQEREDAILSWTGSLLTERWFSEADLLPRSNSLHRLGMRLINDAFAVQQTDASRPPTSTQRAVEKVGAAITGNNPVIFRTRNQELFDPVVPRYSPQENFGGNEFHVWFLDLCLLSYIAAGRYIQNFPQFWEGLRWGESTISYKVVESGETYIVLNAEGNKECSIEDTLLTEGCFDRFRPYVRMTKNKAFVICMASYPLDTSVEVCHALGAVYWDCDTLTMEELIEDPDVVDPEDPTGDGWVGQALDGRFDYPYGGSFDTYGIVEDFLADQCPYERGPVVTPLMATRTDVTITESIVVSGTLVIASLLGPIIQPV